MCVCVWGGGGGAFVCVRNRVSQLAKVYLHVRTEKEDWRKRMEGTEMEEKGRKGGRKKRERGREGRRGREGKGGGEERRRR